MFKIQKNSIYLQKFKNSKIIKILKKVYNFLI